MKHLFLFSFMSILFCCCTTSTETKSDAWAAFLNCPSGKDCMKEALAVKDAFLKNPQQVLTQFQATYEKGDDRVVGWLFMLRDSVLMNPKMGNIEERIAMQQAVVAAAKPFEKDTKVHEMAASVMAELGIADIKAGKVNDPMAAETDETSLSFCYQFEHQGEHIKCELFSAADGKFSGYYSWYIDGKDGTQGVLRGKNFNNDTLFAEHTYIQEGSTQTEDIVFLKKGDNLTQLVGELQDKNGKKVLKNRKALKAGNTLTKVDCAKLTKDFEHIREIEKDMIFAYPDPVLNEKEAKIAENLVGEWQSKDDPKAGIKMENGRFTYTYVGQKPDPSMRYIYYPTCPEDCNPVAKMPCLKIIGQDDVCFSIIKADGKSLDISQIRGTGNINHYVKKK
jgi:hypothetical protein